MLGLPVAFFAPFTHHLPLHHLIFLGPAPTAETHEWLVLYRETSLFTFAPVVCSFFISFLRSLFKASFFCLHRSQSVSKCLFLRSARPAFNRSPPYVPWDWPKLPLTRTRCRRPTNCCPVSIVTSTINCVFPCSWWLLSCLSRTLSLFCWFMITLTLYIQIEVCVRARVCVCRWIKNCMNLSKKNIFIPIFSKGIWPIKIGGGKTSSFSAQSHSSTIARNYLHLLYFLLTFFSLKIKQFLFICSFCLHQVKTDRDTTQDSGKKKFDT